MRMCAHCGQPLTRAANAKDRYCSVNCRVAVFRQKKRARVRAAQRSSNDSPASWARALLCVLQERRIPLRADEHAAILACANLHVLEQALIAAVHMDPSARWTWPPAPRTQEPAQPPTRKPSTPLAPGHLSLEQLHQDFVQLEPDLARSLQYAQDQPVQPHPWLGALREVSDQFHRAIATKVKALSGDATAGKNFLCHNVFPILDELDQMLAAYPREPAPDPTLVALRADLHRLREALLKALLAYGVRSVWPLRLRFDARLHQAVELVLRSRLPPGSIPRVHQRGFLLGHHVLRRAQVGVFRPQPPQR